MTQFAWNGSWVNLAGSAALVAIIALVSTAEAAQDQQRQGGAIQKGRETRTQQTPAPDARAGYDLAKGKTARAAPQMGAASAADQAACESGTASACRSLEAGLTTGGAWSFVDGGITAMDDWEAPATAVSSVSSLAGSGVGAAAASYARSSGSSASPTPAPTPSQDATGHHIPSAVIVHRVLAACDGGDVSACSAFARSVRPATAAERTETRTYTAGR